MYIYGVDFTEESLENILPSSWKKNVQKEEKGFESLVKKQYMNQLIEDTDIPKK